ncbi:hypothetical protein FRB90_010110 [Tulasnella sp. 427]|nr:hypothetical protein FRB90_010110 [Tulasnella sp. 427]
MHLHSESWEVIDQREVPQVPAYYDESAVQITSISSKDVMQTFTFDAPSSSSSPSSPLQKFKLLRPPRSPSFGSRSSRSPSPLSSAYDDDSLEESWDSSFRDPHDFTPAQAREALISARCQLMSSSEMRKMGVNALFSEGWTITKLRKGSKYRLQVTYTARPAKAVLRSGASKASLTGLPPFMDLLEGSL